MSLVEFAARLRAVDPRHVATAAITVLVAGIAVYVLREQLADVHVDQIRAAVYAVPRHAVLLSVLLVAGAYLCLSTYDWLALKVVEGSMPAGQVLVTGFTSYAFSNNLGFALLTGGSIRYRAYSALGVSIADIALITVYSHVAFFLGAGSVIAIAGLVQSQELAAAIGVSPRFIQAIGLASAAGIVVYLALAAFRGRPFTVWRYSIPVPRLPIALAQLAIATVDVFLTSAALYLLLPIDLPYGYLAFSGVTVAAFAAGAASHVPGGLGVVEAILVLSVPDEAKAGLLAAVLLFRVFYYLLPLAVSGGLIAFGAVRSGAGRLLHIGEGAGLALRTVAPQLMGAGVLLAGAVLLFSAMMPAVAVRVALVRQVVPLPILEASHLIASVAGLALLLLARGLTRRLRVAWRLTLVMLAAGIAAALVKGLAWEEAVPLTVALALLAASGPVFHRRAGFSAGAYSPSWLAAIGTILVIVVWFGFFAYRHQDYGAESIWQFAWDADAPRFLRAVAVVGAASLLFLLWRMTAPTRPAGPSAVPVPQVVERLLSHAEDPEANAVLLGDKRLLVTPDESAYVTFQIQGQSWIALGPPVGTPEGRVEAAWAFRELVDSYAGLPVFYSVRADDLPLFLDLGLTVAKYGEEARVPLDAFSIDQPRYKDFRYAVRRAERDGASFAIAPRREVPALLPELRSVSDEWLAAKGGTEKGFSLGYFDDAYLSRFDVAVVRAQGRIVAFANLWQSGVPKAELAVDLMRHRAAAPHGVMDFMFAGIMTAAKAEGYRWFGLGTAPLSGFEQHPLAPTWHKVGNFVFAHGTSLYNFTGLRAFKEKFHPVWTPRYIALPGGFALPRVLMDCALLVSAGPSRHAPGEAARPDGLGYTAGLPPTGGPTA